MRPEGRGSDWGHGNKEGSLGRSQLIKGMLKTFKGLFRWISEGVLQEFKDLLKAY